MADIASTRESVARMPSDAALGGAVIPSAEALPPVSKPSGSRRSRAFLDQAIDDAHSGFDRSYVLAVRGNDRWGLIADITGPLAAAEWDLRECSCAVVAGSVVVLLVVSKRQSSDHEQDLKLLIEEVTEEPDVSVDVFDLADFRIGMISHELIFWHLYIEAVDRPGLLNEIATTIVELGGTVHSLTGELELVRSGRMSRLDVNLLLPNETPRVSVADAMASLKQRIAASEWVLRLSQAPLERRWSPVQSEQAADFAVSVVCRDEGRALTAVTQAFSATRMNVAGARIARFQGLLAMFFLVEQGSDRKDARPAELTRKLARLQALHGTRAYSFPVGQPAAGELSGGEGVGYHFYGDTVDRRGLLARTARLFADAHVNIVRLSSRVAPNTQMCYVDMEVVIPQSAVDLAADLRIALAEMWMNAEFQASDKWRKLFR